jgi:hypothetical protein
MSLLAELRRRCVTRMAESCLVGAWLPVQVAGTFLPVFGWRAWVMQTRIGELAIGFIPALLFSCAFELTPQGLERRISAVSVAYHGDRGT